jgi:hypothetical protein
VRPTSRRPCAPCWPTPPGPPGSGTQPRALVEARYRWEACLAPLEQLYASLESREPAA